METRTGVLRVNVDASELSKWIKMHVCFKKGALEPTIALRINGSVDKALELFKSDTPIVGFDIFVLTINDANNQPHHINPTDSLDVCDITLKEYIPSLKKVIFNISGLHEERKR